MTATVGDAVAPDACLSDTAARHVIDEAAARQRKTSRLSEFLINSELCSFRFDFRAGAAFQRCSPKRQSTTVPWGVLVLTIQ